MSSTTKRRRTRLDPHDRRAQLLACSVAVFAEYGVARATHSQVAMKAGTSVSAVYSYFRTRQDLTIATLTEVERYLDRIFEETRAKGYDAVYGNALSTTVLPTEFAPAIGHVLAVTDNQNLNQLVCENWSEIIDKKNSWGTY